MITVRIPPTEAPLIEVGINGATVELTRDEAGDYCEQIHQAIYITGWTCAHPSCVNHAVSEAGYCREEH